MNNEVMALMGRRHYAPINTEKFSGSPFRN